MPTESFQELWSHNVLVNAVERIKLDCDIQISVRFFWLESSGANPKSFDFDFCISVDSSDLPVSLQSHACHCLIVGHSMPSEECELTDKPLAEHCTFRLHPGFSFSFGFKKPPSCPAVEFL
jgi:hypothetical protein